MGNFCGYAVGADLRVGPFCDDETAPFHAVGAAICRPGGGPAGGWRTGGHIGPPLQGHASHSDLCCSHQAGNAGSFGERVGVTALQSGVSWYLAINLLIILISFAADK